MRRGIDGLAAIVKDKFDLDPEKHLKYLLYKLPNESTLTDKEALSAYLPWTKQVQASCRYILNIINLILAQAKVGF